MVVKWAPSFCVSASLCPAALIIRSPYQWGAALSCGGPCAASVCCHPPEAPGAWCCCLTATCTTPPSPWSWPAATPPTRASSPVASGELSSTATGRPATGGLNEHHLKHLCVCVCVCGVCMCSSMFVCVCVCVYLVGVFVSTVKLPTDIRCEL